MSRQRLDSQRSFYHTRFVCGESFGAADRYRLFREKILPPAFSAASAVRDALLREQRAAGDRSGAVVRGDVAPLHGERAGSKNRRASVYHLGWKYALDLELPYEGFRPTVLVYFRDQLEEKQAERVIFDGIVDLLIELGLIKRAGKQRIDSTHILGYVKEMSRLECAVETVRLAPEELASVLVPGKRPEFW